MDTMLISLSDADNHAMDEPPAITFDANDIAKLDSALKELERETDAGFAAWFYDQLPDPLRLELEIL